MSQPILRSTLNVKIREINEEERYADFVAATEKPVTVGPGDPEVLRMKGCDLSRFERNPVLLDTHQRTGLDKVIGHADVAVEGKFMAARCYYADNDAGENAWRLVKGGHVRSLSIGYAVDKDSVRKLRRGEVDGDTKGPAVIANKWTLLEVSTVPIPADEEAVRRSYFDSIQVKERSMAGKNKRAPMKSSAPNAKAPGTSTNDEEVLGDTGPVRDEGGSDGDENMTMEIKGKKYRLVAIERADDGEGGGNEDGDMASDADDEDGRAGTTSGAQAGPQVKKSSPGMKSYGTMTMGEVHARELAAQASSIRAIVDMKDPKMRAVANKCILEGMNLEEARAVLVEAQAARYKPLGTPSEREVPENGNRGAIEQVTDEILVRSLEALSE